jgi:hypothetical protein
MDTENKVGVRSTPTLFSGLCIDLIKLKQKDY